MIPWDKVGEIISRFSKRNAMYPLLIALFLAVVLAVSVISISGNTIIGLGALLIVAVVILQINRSFNHFSQNNPEMLRTETHVQYMRALTILGDKDNPLRANAKDVVSLISEPSLPALPPPGKDHEE